MCPASNPNGTPNLKSPQNVSRRPGRTLATQPPYLRGGNKNLQPEKSTNYTAGLILEPIKGWSTTFDYYYIKLKNQIVNVGQQPDLHATIPQKTVRTHAAARDLR